MVRMLHTVGLSLRIAIKVTYSTINYFFTVPVVFFLKKYTGLKCWVEYKKRTKIERIGTEYLDVWVVQKHFFFWLKY